MAEPADIPPIARPSPPQNDMRFEHDQHKQHHDHDHRQQHRRAPQPCLAGFRHRHLPSQPSSACTSYTTRPSDSKPRCRRTTSRSFLDLPAELRAHVYGYMLLAHASSAADRRIELADIRAFTGEPVAICLSLGWTFFLMSRQIAAEGVAHAFRFSRVKLLAGPWVLKRFLQRIERASWEARMLEGETRPDSRLAVLMNSPNQDTTGLLPTPPRGKPFILPCIPLSEDLSPSVRISLLTTIRALELDWRTVPNDVHASQTRRRIVEHEIEPLLKYLRSACPNLAHLVIPLRYGTHSDAPPRRIHQGEWYFRELIARALTSMLGSRADTKSATRRNKHVSGDAIAGACAAAVPWRTVTVRYRPCDPWAALQPVFGSGAMLLEHGLWAMLRRERLPELQQVLEQVGEKMGRPCDENVVDVDVNWVQWQPDDLLASVGDQLELSFRAKEYTNTGAEDKDAVKVQETEHTIVEVGHEEENESVEDEDEDEDGTYEDEFVRWKQETDIKWELYGEEEAYGLFLTQTYSWLEPDTGAEYD